ncbi:hypothetical protein BCH308197_D0009 (plasmid) [Bacillus cereus H3081.97]|nr:hypothetical protein BCH308197_D0009 [Bacillus cereus H3081.97]
MGLGKAQGFVFATWNVARQSRRASQTPIDFDAKASKYV